MSSKEVFVFVNLGGVDNFVGRLWCHNRKGRESASFEYDRVWLNHAERFALEPALMLAAGSFHTSPGQMLFGAIGDSAPDRWGRVLMRRAARAFATQQGAVPHSLSEVDYLLSVNDEARQGALRFSLSQDGPFLATSAGRAIPPLLDLPKLLSATERFLDDQENADDLKMLLAPGSSLGGARPKASVRDQDGHLAIAKFSRKDDEYDAVIWEAIALDLAKKASISVPEWRLIHIHEKPVLVVRRFDRKTQLRIPFLSAMSMLGARDNETHSYLEIADVLRQHGARPNADLAELWRRLVFNILISNTDDHLRNHGFLYQQESGWCLSPAYDLNPTPIEVKPRILTTLINFEDATASLDLAMSVAKDFRLSLDRAKSIAHEVAQAVSQWKNVAISYGALKPEINRMASAFEHDDLKQALL